jgi:rhodanese-related sulfurtransferase
MEGKDHRRSPRSGRAGTSVVLVLLLVVTAGAVFMTSPSAETIMSDEQKRERIDTLYQKYTRKFPQVSGVTAVELKAELDSGKELLLVDVRKPEEQAVSMIPGAITQKDFERRQESFRDRPVVTYCTAGYRSGLYAKKLMKQGWQVRNLEGSLLSWTHAGGPLVDSDGQPTRRVHVYSADWSLEASSYEPVW